MKRQIVTSKLTARYQITVPKKIRKILDLHPGDPVAFEVAGAGTVLLRKPTAIDLEFAKALEVTLASEWLSDNDEKAYALL